MLYVVMYHYVRDLPRTAYPRIKGMLLDDFREQVDDLSQQYEMASVESTLDYLAGRYVPTRDLCLLTFDDGLKEHFAEVTPILADRNIQGVFSVITSCLEDHAVVPVHMNHFLMAGLDFSSYKRAFLERLAERNPSLAVIGDQDAQLVKRTYPWDELDVASFKYFFNFQLDPEVRDSIVKILFTEYIGSEREFSKELYLSWDEARQMQSAGMSIGGHTHEHRPLACLSGDRLKTELETCTRLMHANLQPQAAWPFCYPYGKSDSFQPAAVEWLKRLGYACAFTTETGGVAPGAGPFTITRFDCKKAPVQPRAQFQSVGGVA